MKDFLVMFLLTAGIVVGGGYIYRFVNPSKLETQVMQYKQFQAQQRMPQQSYQLTAQSDNPQFGQEGPGGGQEMELDADKVVFAINMLTTRVSALEAQVQALSQALSSLPPPEQSDY